MYESTFTLYVGLDLEVVARHTTYNDSKLKFLLL